MTLTKAEMADLLFDQVGLNKREAKDMVEAFFEEIRSSFSSVDQRMSQQQAALFRRSPARSHHRCRGQCPHHGNTDTRHRFGHDRAQRGALSRALPVQRARPCGRHAGARHRLDRRHARHRTSVRRTCGALQLGR